MLFNYFLSVFHIPTALSLIKHYYYLHRHHQIKKKNPHYQSCNIYMPFTQKHMKILEHHNRKTYYNLVSYKSV